MTEPRTQAAGADSAVTKVLADRRTSLLDTSAMPVAVLAGEPTVEVVPGVVEL